jgi:CRP-like cAMP-binding protein
LLTYLSKFFGKPVAGGATMLDFPLTHEHLASWAGMTRVSISQAIGKLKKQSLIRYDKNHIVIPDLKKLAETAAV